MPTDCGRILQELLEPVSASLNERAARKLIRLQVSDRRRARVAALARKCNEGDLGAKERAEYETYVMAGEVVAILQAQARRRLARRRQTA